MTTAHRLRCPCGYETRETPRPGHELVAVYHLHPGAPGWGPHSVRMEAVEESVEEATPLEVTVRGEVVAVG